MTDLPALIDGAMQALQEARTVDEVVKVRDMAAALQRMSKGVEGARHAYNRCGEIKIHAERRMGEELARSQLKPGRPEKNPDSREGFFPPPKLADIGITEKQSSRYQQLASIPEPALREHLAAVKEGGGEVTTAGALSLARRIAVESQAHKAPEPALGQAYRDLLDRTIKSAERCYDLVKDVTDLWQPEIPEPVDSVDRLKDLSRFICVKLGVGADSGYDAGHRKGSEDSYNKGHKHGASASFRLGTRPSVTPADQWVDDNLANLIRFCHPDRHLGSADAEAVTQWLLARRPAI